MPVDAPQSNGRSVDEEKPVPTLYVPEAHSYGHRLRHAALGIEQGDHRLVEPRLLGRPSLDRPTIQTSSGQTSSGQMSSGQMSSGLAPLDRDYLMSETICAVVKLDPDVISDAITPGPADFCRDDDAAGLCHGLVGSIDDHISEVNIWPPHQRDVAEYAGEPPHVLVLQVATVRPLVHGDRQHVVARSGRARDIELRRHPAALAVAHRGTVPEHVHGAVHALETQYHGARLEPGGVDVYTFAIAPGRVLGGDPWGVDRERINHVRVMGLAVAVKLPMRWDRDLVPAVVDELDTGKFVRDSRRASGQMKPPTA